MNTRTKVTQSLEQLDIETRVQYGLMFLFGALCLIAAAAPLDLLIKVAVVSTLFGLTAGIWIAHLVQIVQRAADRNRAATGTDQ